MSVEELTRELARHGMKPGPRGYMVGAMLQVWATAAAEVAAPPCATTVAADVNVYGDDNDDGDDDGDDGGNGGGSGGGNGGGGGGGSAARGRERREQAREASAREREREREASARVSDGGVSCASEGDSGGERNMFWDDGDGGDGYDDDMVYRDEENNEPEPVNNNSDPTGTGGGNVSLVPATHETKSAAPAPAQAVRDIVSGVSGLAPADGTAVVLTKKRKAAASKPAKLAKLTPLPLEDRLGLWIKSQPELYDRVLLMETVDVNELLEVGLYSC
jgi:hypothetical protein